MKNHLIFRPFHKRLDRVLLGALRSSEALAAIGWVQGNEVLANEVLFDKLQLARRWHSLFQHHDGVAGTSREDVVIDYAQKMIKALNNSEHVLQQSILHLLKSRQDLPVDPQAIYFTIDESRFAFKSNTKLFSK